MQPLPSITQAYALLMQDEKQKEIHASTKFVTENAAMHVNSTHRFNTNKSLISTNCKKSGHTVAKCYRLIGFPKDFKFNNPKRMAANVSNESQTSNAHVLASTTDSVNSC